MNAKMHVYIGGVDVWKWHTEFGPHGHYSVNVLPPTGIVTTTLVEPDDIYVPVLY